MFNAPGKIRTVRSRIWIADANPLDYANLEVEANRKDMHIRFFVNAPSLLHYWRSSKPDVCLIDVDLPDISGLDLADMLRPFPDGTTIGLAANTFDQQTEIRALTLGVHCCLCKPIEVNMLCACLPKTATHSKKEPYPKNKFLPTNYDLNFFGGREHYCCITDGCIENICRLGKNRTR